MQSAWDIYSASEHLFKVMLASTPKPPYYAVIFSSLRTEEDNGYEEMSAKMIEEVEKQPGFLGFETAREIIGITVSYWKDQESIRKWKNHLEHRVAQKKGKSEWYSHYIVRICKVERDYSMLK